MVDRKRAAPFRPRLVPGKCLAGRTADHRTCRRAHCESRQRMILRKAYYGGTHRVLSPEATLAKIEPHLSAIGVTRCADVTGLDRIGIPVFCAIRPQGKMIQVTN